METMGKVAGLALTAAVICVVLRQQEKPLAMLLSLGASIGVVLLALGALEPVVDLLRRLKELSGVSDQVAGPVLKVTGIGLLTKAAGGICFDSGEGTLGKAVELSGTLLCMYASLPLLLAVMDLIETLIGRTG